MLKKTLSSLFGSKKSANKKKTTTVEVAGNCRECKQISDLYIVSKDTLGSGGFSVVKKGVHKEENGEWALKLIQNSVFRKNKEQTQKEVDILGSLDHPGVVKLKEVVLTQRHFVIVMELLTGGELFDRIVQREKYNEEDAKKVASNILSTLDYLHKNKIVHRDLKPENLIFDRDGDDANLKLTDFGFADLSSNALTATCGTPEYVAPEILDEKPYSNKVDMWSTGVIVYILLCGFPPFYGDNDQDLFEKVCAADYEFVKPYWNNVSDEAKDLIRKLLELDPKKRLSAEQALQHPWFGMKSEGADLSSALNQLNRFQATRKFRKAVYVLMAANKMNCIVDQQQQQK